MKENSASYWVDFLVYTYMSKEYFSTTHRSQYKNILSSWFFVFLFSFSLLFSIVWLARSVDTATPPTIITYQGKLLEAGASVTTTKAISFTLYDAGTLGTALYTAAGTLPTISTINVTPTQGIFSVDLGGSGTNALDPAIFQNNDEIYLEIVVAGTTLTPRKRLTASPYAVNSAYLNGVGATSTPQSVTYIPLSDVDGSFVFGTTTFTSSITVSSTATSTFLGSINLPTGKCFSVNSVCITSGGGSSQWSDSGSDIYFDTGRVSIGTTTLSETLSVDGSLVVTGTTTLSAGSVRSYVDNSMGTSISTVDTGTGLTGSAGVFRAMSSNPNLGAAFVLYPTSTSTIPGMSSVYAAVLGISGGRPHLSLGNPTDPSIGAGFLAVGDGSGTRIRLSASTTEDSYIRNDFLVGSSSNLLFNLNFTMNGDDFYVQGDSGFNGNIFSNGIFDVDGTGTSTFAGSIDLASGKCFAVNGVCLTSGGGSSQWTTAGDVIYYEDGPVLIGANTSTYTTIPQVGLVVRDEFIVSEATTTNTPAGMVFVNNVTDYGYIGQFSDANVGLFFDGTSVDGDAILSLNSNDFTQLKGEANETGSILQLINTNDVMKVGLFADNDTTTPSFFLDGISVGTTTANGVLNVVGEAYFSDIRFRASLDTPDATPVAVYQYAESGIGTGIYRVVQSGGPTVPSFGEEGYGVGGLFVDDMEANYYDRSWINLGSASDADFRRILTLRSDGTIEVPGTTTSTFNGGIDITAGCFSINGTCISGGSSQWSDSGSDIYFSSGNVGIGTSDVASGDSLSVSGTIRIADNSFSTTTASVFERDQITFSEYAPFYSQTQVASISFDENGGVPSFSFLNSGAVGANFIFTTENRYTEEVSGGAYFQTEIFGISDSTSTLYADDIWSLSIDANKQLVGVGTSTLWGDWVSETDPGLVIDGFLYQTTGNATFMNDMYVNGNVGIGTSTPSALLEVVGGDAVINGVTVGRGGGDISSNTGFGASVLSSNTTGNYSSAFGSFSLSSNTVGTYNNAFGYGALFSNTTASHNNAFGTSALQSNITGTLNNAFGSSALFANTTGSSNNAFGYRSLVANTTGDQNNAFGSSALLSNTTGTQNNAFGTNALSSNTSGNSNSAFGDTALSSNTTGFFNNAFGSSALSSNTTGNYNNAFGNSALTSNTTGLLNNAFGYTALSANTTGANNSAFGGSSLNRNTTGDTNSAFGASALRFNTTGNQNNAFGSSALYSNTTGASNNAFGSSALFSNTTGTLNNAFGDSALGVNTTGASNNAFGYQALWQNTTGSSNSAFGNVALSANTTGAQNNAFGSSALLFNTTGTLNNAFGFEALRGNISGSSNSAFGNLALRANTIGTLNNAFGASALRFNTTGVSNSGFGDETLRNNSSGSYNSALGGQALYRNTTGSWNTSVGYQTLIFNTSSEYNSAFGSFALINTTGGYNTGVGAVALDDNTTGSSNTAVGYQALDDNTSGSNNTAFGRGAMNDLLTGSYNVAIGGNTGDGITTGSYNTIIGAQVSGLPSALSNNIIIADGQGNQRIRVLDSGYVGIGTTTPSYLLHVVTSTDSIVAAFTDTEATCTIAPSDGDFSCTSDRDLKTNITVMGTALDSVMRLSPVAYNWNTDPNGETNYGFIAQEVEAIFPRLVGAGANGYKTLSQIGLIPYLTKAIQEQQLQIETLSSALLQGSGASLLDGSFDGTLRVAKHVSFGEDTVGQAKLLAGATSVRVTFVELYEYQPIVTVSPLAFISGQYRVTEENEEGFTLELSESQPSDVVFNWHAFAGEGAKLTVSDGSFSDITLVVVDQGEASSGGGSEDGANEDTGTPDEGGGEGEVVDPTVEEVLSGEEDVPEDVVLAPPVEETVPESPEVGESEPVETSPESAEEGGAGEGALL